MRSWFMAGSYPQDYEQGIDSSVTYHEKNSGYLKAKVLQPEGFGTLMQMFKADLYRNKRMSFSALVKSEGVEKCAGLWMRVDGPKGEKPLSFDNMHNRPIQGTTGWQQYRITLEVPQESINIAFGILLEGKGQVWLNDVQFKEGRADEITASTPLVEYPGQPGNLDFTED